MNKLVAENLLTHAWFCLLGIMLILYVITDGFDLGVGILSLCRPRERDADRDQMIESIGQVWDANETWLVVLGGALFGAFPAAYAMLLSNLYVPIMLLVASLVMRGASIEFRHVASRSKLLWDRVFGLGSLLAAIAQGVVLGKVITGLQPGGLNAVFVVLTAFGVVSGYALLGATWLVKKTVGSVQRTARKFSLIALCSTVACAMVVSIGTLIISPVGSSRWNDPGVFHLLVFFGFITAAAACYVLFATALGAERGPFIGSILLFLASFVGLAVSLFPDLVPGHLTVAAAASDSGTLIFMLLGIGMVLPIMITYNVYQYRCFKGKVALPEH
jgi:cytochrome bd ubiquinol oxidase subunit II